MTSGQRTNDLNIVTPQSNHLARVGERDTRSKTELIPESVSEILLEPIQTNKKTSDVLTAEQTTAVLFGLVDGANKKLFHEGPSRFLPNASAWAKRHAYSLTKHGALMLFSSFLLPIRTSLGLTLCR
jgi:hypothetical protein